MPGGRCFDALADDAGWIGSVVLLRESYSRVPDDPVGTRTEAVRHILAALSRVLERRGGGPQLPLQSLDGLAARRSLSTGQFRAQRSAMSFARSPGT